VVASDQRSLGLAFPVPVYWLLDSVLLNRFRPGKCSIRAQAVILEPLD